MSSPISPQSIYDSTSLFAEHVQFLTSFNPDFHLDDSYLRVSHPRRVEGLFSRRFGQLPIVGENSPLNMDPINWRYMYRPNRPFHFITNDHLRRSIPKLPPRPWMERDRQKPSAYVAEQMKFFNEAPAPIPEADKGQPIDDGRPPGPLKVLVHFFEALVLSLAWMLLMLVAMMLWAVERIGRGAVRVYQQVGVFPWETVWVALAAIQLLMFLPGMEGGRVVEREVVKGDAPLYVLMIANPNQHKRGA